MSSAHTITIVPGHGSIVVDSGKSLIDALVDHSIFLRSDCGGRGICDKCKVYLLQPDGTKQVTNSCTHEVVDDLTIEIPESSRLATHVITKAPATFPPSFQKHMRSIGATDSNYGIAVDLGTTTIAVYLCHIGKGEVIASSAIKNPQALYGDDVMSRIGAIDIDGVTLPHLQEIVVSAIELGIKRLLEETGLSKDKVNKLVVVGNPTMVHILLKVDPSPLGTFPYKPVFHEAKTVKADDVGFDLGEISLQTLPQVSGFIGGDILSAALAVDLENQPRGTLLIDLGTNGELLFKGDDRLYATSCATGPAFEGATLSCGTQAIPGAINKVSIVRDSEYPSHTIINPYNFQDLKPCGVCGTGVISSIAELCRHGIIESSGSFQKEGNIRPLMRDGDNRLKYILLPQEKTQDNSTIHISQKDVRSVQLGKAALITGIEFLLKAAGYDCPEKIIIAGAFGSFIEIEDLFTLGMIPTIPADRVEIAGNSAGAGAVMVICDDAYLQKAIEMASQITTIDLAGDTQFQEVFVQRLRFSPMKSSGR